MPVTNEMLKLLLNDLSIEEAVDQKRLFICDLEILEGIYVKDGFVVNVCLCFRIKLFICISTHKTQNNVNDTNSMYIK